MADAASLVHSGAFPPQSRKSCGSAADAGGSALGPFGRAAGVAKASDLKRHLLGGDPLRRQRKQPALVLVGQRDLNNLLALAADGERCLAVAGPVIAGNEGRAGLEPMHHAELDQLI